MTCPDTSLCLRVERKRFPCNHTSLSGSVFHDIYYDWVPLLDALAQRLTTTPHVLYCTSSSFFSVPSSEPRSACSRRAPGPTSWRTYAQRAARRSESSTAAGMVAVCSTSHRCARKIWEAPASRSVADRCVKLWPFSTRVGGRNQQTFLLNQSPGESYGDADTINGHNFPPGALTLDRVLRGTKRITEDVFVYSDTFSSTPVLSGPRVGRQVPHEILRGREPLAD